MNLFLSALIVTVGTYLFSYFWFGPLLFQRIYLNALKEYSTAKPYPRTTVFSLFFVFSYLALVVLAYFIYKMPEINFWAGVRMGLYFWLFYAAVEFCNSLFNRTNLIISSINWGYWLISLVLAGGALASLIG